MKSFVFPYTIVYDLNVNIIMYQIDFFLEKCEPVSTFLFAQCSCYFFDSLFILVRNN